MNDSIDRFCAAAVAANLPLTFLNHPAGEHGRSRRMTSFARIIRAAGLSAGLTCGVVQESQRQIRRNCRRTETVDRSFIPGISSCPA